MQITIEIPDKLSQIIQSQGKSLDIAITEALELYLYHNRSMNTIPTPSEEKIDWSTKWEQWFAECRTITVTATTQPSKQEYKSLLIDKYREQGLDL
jgi:hypothetical protein